MKPLLTAGAILLLFLTAVPADSRVTAQETPQQETTQPPPPPAPEPQPEPMPEAEATEQPSCGDCHDIAAPFAHNPHARGQVENKVVPNGVCETCHGDGTAHIEAGGDPTLIRKPQGLSGSDEVCMNCHDASTDKQSRKHGVHANSATVNCLSCHSIHHSDPGSARLLAQPELKLCNTCHQPQVSSFRNKPYTHRLGHGTMGCTSCHEPHGRQGKENLRQTTAGERTPCFNCHSEKRGPHVFPHGARLTSDCQNCHEPHGSNNPNQLTRAQVYQLCLECHSPTSPETLGSQPPAFHNLNSPRFRNCTTCHVAVHGSNRSPALLK